MAFSKKRVEDRKEWLRNFVPGTYLDQSASKISYCDFVNKARARTRACLPCACRNACLQACVRLGTLCVQQLAVTVQQVSGGAAHSRAPQRRGVHSLALP